MAETAGINLKVDAAQLEAKAQTVSDLVDDVEDAFEEIKAIVENSKAYWEGFASEKHQKLYSEKKEDITKIIKRLKEHPDDLLKMAGIYKEAERKNKELATQLKTDIIV